jgi:ankyrin repeat protein
MAEAVSQRDIDRARAARERGADPNKRLNEAAPSFRGSTLLTDAVLSGSEEMVALLVTHGAAVTAEAPEDGSTSLHIAVEYGHTAILERLLQTAVGPHLSTFDYIERTPLHCAAERGDVEAARMLLEAGADVNAANEDRAGDSALTKAVEAGRSDMVALLIKAGADPLAKGWMWLTPLDRATGTQDPERVRIREMLEAAVRKRKHNRVFQRDAGHPRKLGT